MNQQNTPTLDDVKRDICVALGLDPERPPLTLTDKQVAEVLGVKTSTLAIWRSTGRYNVPFSKSGRLIRYPLDGIASHYMSHIFNHTGEM